VRPPYEVADVLDRFDRDFVGRHGSAITSRVATVLTRIQQCRTAVLGGHRMSCASCGASEISYNSCRDRHCPKCGGSRRARWLDAQSSALLPVPYFHVVFTLPHELAPLALRNPGLVYGLVFRAASETLLELAADPRHMGARIGVTAILHTWGQNLEHHPHVHCVVTGGGLSPDDARWVHGRPRFFVSARVMRKLYRGKLLAFLSRAYAGGEVALHGSLQGLRNPQAFARLVRRLRRKKWVVYAKAPFGGPERTLKYLARYTHRVAISNHRLLSVDGRGVRFRWRDYRDGVQKVMTLDGAEFLRRFAMHVLPKGFVRIRHYGLLAACKRRDCLARSRELLDAEPQPAPAEPAPQSTPPVLASCPTCGEPQVIVITVVGPVHGERAFSQLWWDSS